MRSWISSGMLDDVGGMADDPGDQHHILRQLHVRPHLPFMLMTRIGPLDHERADLQLEDQVDDAPERNVGGVRPRPAPPAHVIADLLARQVFDRLIENLDVARHPFEIVLQRRRRHHAVERDRGARVVELHQQAVVDDLLVFVAHRGADCRQHVVIVLVVFVLAVRDDTCRCRHRQEAFRHLHLRQRRFEIVDVLLQQLLTGVADRPDHDEIHGRRSALLRVELGVELCEPAAVGAARPCVASLERPPLEAAEAVQHVLGPRERLAVFAVADDVETALGLLPHHLSHRILQGALVGRLVVGLAGLLGAKEFLQFRRPDQAADVGGENTVRAALHDVPFCDV